MDRNIVYPGSLPQDTDILNTAKNAMLAVGFLAQATIGSNVAVDGLACTQTSVASMTVNVGPGSIISLQPVDATAFGSLAADTADTIVKMGVNLGTTPFTLTAPGTSGQSINYLIEAEFTETDTNPVVLPYYNPTNPAVPYSGPSNSGAAQNTQRIQRVGLQLKAGAAATTGTQTTPAVDSGWAGLYYITVNYGQTTVTSSSIFGYPGSPRYALKLPQLQFSFTSSLVGNGWKKYPDLSSPTGYFIEQWGTQSGATGTSNVITLPIPFPTAFLNVVASDNGASCYSYGCYPLGLTQFTWYSATTSTHGCYWRALGY